MDINSPEKSTGGFNKENGATLSDKTDLNASGDKEGFAIGSLNCENEVTHDERKVYMNMGYTSPSMPLCDVNEGSQSSLPVTNQAEMTGAIDANPDISSVQSKTLDYNIEGERMPIKDHQEDVHEDDVNTRSTVCNLTEIEGLSYHLNNPLDKGDNDHYNSIDRENTEMHNENMSYPEVVNADCGLPVNSQLEKIGDNEERDYENLSLKSSYEVQVTEGCYSDTVPPENVGMVWEHSSLQSPQETQIVSPSERRLSVSAERSPHKQSPSKSPTFPKKEISSPTNFDSEQIPPPRTSRRRYSPSPEKHRSGHKRAASRDRSSPPMRKESPPDRASKREAYHRDDSPMRHFSGSPQKHGSPQRAGRSTSKSPMRRRYSSRNRRNQQHSRSRSPIARDHNRRSPRRRSPRRRSPFYSSGRRSPRKQWSPPANRNTGVGKPGRNLYVAGFSYGTTERDLERKFSKFGRVTDVRVVRERRSGDSRGFGFLSLERDEDADAAIRAVDQTEWNGRIILVEKSKSSSRRS